MVIRKPWLKLCCLTFPSIFAFIGMWVFNALRWEFAGFLGMLSIILFYGTVTTGVAIGYVKYRAYAVWTVPVGFILPALICYIYETINPSWLQYVMTFIVTQHYSAPFALVTFALSLIVRVIAD